MAESDSSTEFSTLIGLLHFRAANQPDHLAYTFLSDGESEDSQLTYKDLETKARSIALGVKPLIGQGDRILLLFLPGLEFITAFFGCIYAGAVAVPAYPPEPARI